MPDLQQSQSRYIKALKSKIEILQNENAQLAERGEDTLLLGIVSEHINKIDDISELIHAGLERVSLLKNIPFCAHCRSVKNRLLIENYYFLQSNDRLVSTELVFPEEIQEAVLSTDHHLIHCNDENACPLIEFESVRFTPDSMLVITSKSVVGVAEVFCFAAPGDDKKLSKVTQLLARVVEMLCARIDTLTLMAELQDLNAMLDRKVRGRTKELAEANTVLEENEKKFRGLFNQALDMIHFISVDGTIIGANPAELKTMKYAGEDYIGKPLMDFIDPAFAGSARNALTRIFSGQEIKGHQSVMIAGDGSKIDVEVNIVPELEDGKVVRAMAIARNVTERKQMEEQLLKVKKIESIGVLAGGIAHDFNNILAAILGNISLANQLIPSGDRIHSLLSDAEKASLRAKELTQQLLTFSKGGEPIRKLSSIADVIKDSAGFVLRGTNVQCTHAFAKDLWPVEIDRSQISQVVQNLVINARHAMPMGGKIEITCENYIHDQAYSLPIPPANYVKISIKDQGAGIPASHLDRIFDPYFTTKQEGSGLGLAVTHSIIIKHKGYIEVESQDGAGAVFTIYLPASRDNKRVSRSEDEKKEWHGKGKILIMDDDEMILDFASKMLTHAGYDVVVAGNGDEAVEVFKKEREASEPVGAAILDLTIPGGMGGKDTAGILKKMSPDTPLIVSSGYSNDTVMANYREHGFSAAIVKPYIFKELMEVCRKIFSGA